MSPSAQVMGVDLGTQSVKVAVLRGGEILATATRPYPVTSPRPGWAQSEPSEWLAAVEEAVAQVVETVGLPSAVSLSGQMHGVVVADDELHPLTPGIIWADGRSTEQSKRISAHLRPEHLARLGSAAFPGFLGPTVAWLLEHEPGLMERARWLLSPKDFVRAQWTGEVITDRSDASGTLLFDVVDQRWDAAALEVCGVSADRLPRVDASDGAAGVIRSGLLRGVPVSVGGADTACVIHGLGLSGGEGYLGLGTGTQIVSVLDDPLIDPTLRTHTFDTVSSDSAGWYRLAAVQSGGLALSQALSWLGAQIEDAQSALRSGVRTDDPLFLPFVAGERSPFLDPDLRASWAGLSLASDRAALLRSVLEGLAFAAAAGARALEDTLPRGPLPVVGGGSRDDAYLRLLAEVLGCALAPVATGDAAVVGAARLAGPLAGVDVPGIRENVGRSHIIEPEGSPLVAERFVRWLEKVDERLGL